MYTRYIRRIVITALDCISTKISYNMHPSIHPFIVEIILFLKVLYSHDPNANLNVCSAKLNLYTLKSSKYHNPMMIWLKICGNELNVLIMDGCVISFRFILYTFDQLNNCLVCNFWNLLFIYAPVTDIIVITRRRNTLRVYCTTLYNLT